MNTPLENLVRDVLRDAAAAEQPPAPARFADAALRDRRRRHVAHRFSLLAAAAATAAAVIAAPLVVQNMTDSPRRGLVDTTPTPPPCAGAAKPRGERCGEPVAMPGTKMTYLDAPGPLSLTSYMVSPVNSGPDFRNFEDHSRAYVRDATTGRFEATRFSHAVVSPDGRRMATISGRLPTRELTITDRAGSVRAVVPLPTLAASPLWSPDGTKILLTAWEGGFPDADGNGGRRVGFILIDVGVGRATFVRVAQPRYPGNTYRWANSSSEILADDAELRFLDLRGKVVRSLEARSGIRAGLGLPLSSDRRRFVATVTPPAGGIDALIDARTGRRIRDLTFDGMLEGWYDDRYLLAYIDPTRASSGSLYITDLNGKRARMLVWVPPGAEDEAWTDMEFTGPGR